MERYEDWSAEELAMESSFVGWVLGLSDEDALFWENWLASHPQAHGRVEEARRLLLSFRETAGTEPSDEAEEADVRAVMRHIRRPAAFRRWFIRSAAALAILAGAGTGVWYYLTRQTSTVTEWHTTTQVQQVTLPDQSVVTLSPNSHARYRDAPNGERVVEFSGEAFFKVTRNEHRPFVIYAGNMVTRVLGTSFWLRTKPQARTIELDVVTGKVAVYDRRNRRVAYQSMNEVTLLPNQRATYSTATGDLKKGLVDNPVGEAAPSGQFRFTNTPIQLITAKLSKKYGIVIDLPDPLVGSCTFTGDLNDLSLYEQLDLICQSIHANYQIKQAQIVIRGQGCR